MPGAMVGVSSAFVPLALKGIVVDPQKPLEFQFIVDTGSGPKDGLAVKAQADELVKYFLAGLTVPEGDLWVNLSPYEKDRMTTPSLGGTGLGRDLLAQDYILKQLTASFIYPESDLGKQFWSKVYQKAQEKFGTTDIPISTFNKVWILPDQAQVFENGASAYVTRSTLKVMLDQDYLASQKQKIAPSQADSISADIVRQIVIPEIEKEVNTGKNFAPLRQIYQALILAKWYKETVQNALFDAAYTNKSKIKGIDLNDPTVKEQIYGRYLEAYKKGVFNYIKDDQDPNGQTAPKKYFSGGLTPMPKKVDRSGDQGMIASGIKGVLLLLTVSISVLSSSFSIYAQQDFKGMTLSRLIDNFKVGRNELWTENFKINASEIVNTYGVKATPELTKALNNKDPFVRMGAIRSLGLIYKKGSGHSLTGNDKKVIVSALTGLLRDHDGWMYGTVDEEAIDALRNIGPDAKDSVPALFDLWVTSIDLNRRWGTGIKGREAVAAIGITNDQMIAFLKRIPIGFLGRMNYGNINRKSDQERVLSIVASESDSSFNALRLALNDPSEDVRLEAVIVMGKVTGDAIGKSRKALEEVKLNDRSRKIRKVAEDVLSRNLNDFAMISASNLLSLPIDKIKFVSLISIYDLKLFVSRHPELTAFMGAVAVTGIPIGILYYRWRYFTLEGIFSRDSSRKKYLAKQSREQLIQLLRYRNINKRGIVVQEVLYRLLGDNPTVDVIIPIVDIIENGKKDDIDYRSLNYLLDLLHKLGDRTRTYVYEDSYVEDQLKEVWPDSYSSGPGEVKIIPGYRIWSKVERTESSAYIRGLIESKTNTFLGGYVVVGIEVTSEHIQQVRRILSEGKDFIIKDTFTLDYGLSTGEEFGRANEGYGGALFAISPVIESVDKAMQSSLDRGLGKNNLGGIDLNQIAVKRTGKVIDMKVDPARFKELMEGGFEGFRPVIISLTPIQSPYMLLGVDASK